MTIGEESIYLRPVDSVMNTHIAEVSKKTSIYEAAKIMVNRQRSSATRYGEWSATRHYY